MELKPFYQDEWTTIYHGDCREVLPSLVVDPAKVALISDPPYGINAKHERAGLKRRRTAVEWDGNARVNWQPIQGDNEAFDPSHLLGFSIVALFGANHFACSLPAQYPAKPWKWLLWDKRCGSRSDNNSDGEIVWTNRTGALRIHRQLWRGIVRAGEEN